MGELRKDVITGEWVNIATERAKRPTDFHHREEALIVHTSYRPSCPFCLGSEGMTGLETLRYEAGAKRGAWLVRVVQNRFPAFSRGTEAPPKERGIFQSMPAIGAHEVVIETPEHGKSLARLPLSQVELVLTAYRERYLALCENPQIKYILVFRNHGRVAGASIKHAHSQIIGTPVVPRSALDKIHGLERYERTHGRCVYCDIVDQEQRMGERLVASNRSFIAFAPYASRHPFETWVVPVERNAHFTAISAVQMRDFAAILRETLLRLELCLNDPPYNYMLLTTDFTDRFHWHLEIIPRLSIAAGFEFGTGIYINSVPPESAAACLRAVKLPPEHTMLRREGRMYAV